MRAGSLERQHLRTPHRSASSVAFLGALGTLGWALPAAAQKLPGRLDGVLARIDTAFGNWLVSPVAAVLFFDLYFWDNAEADETRLPVIVVWLVCAALFFTLRWRFINVRAFRHALAVLSGKYDDPNHPGEVSHFQALASALSATVGLGNIGGVAVAIGLGGPGASLWMFCAGFLGMSLKFTECTLGQMYRTLDAEGKVLGGPMRYLRTGLAERGEAWAPLGRWLAGLFAVLCIGGSFGGGNMFQSNQSYAQAARVFPVLDSSVGALAFGTGLAALVALVIIGGIKRIAMVAGYIVPAMCGLYVLAALWILGANLEAIPDAIATIFREAWTPRAGFGGALGVAAMGFRRAAFSNEAGVGSAPIAHSAAATDEPVREGIVALLEPFIDTLVVCTMTALVVIVTGAYKSDAAGVIMTSNAFASVLPWFPHVLSMAVFLFAISTAISWSYYGERCWTFLFGARSAMAYRWLYVAALVLGAVIELENVVAFSDLMILGMALPNLIGLYFLAPKVSNALDAYWSRFGTKAPHS